MDQVPPPGPPTSYHVRMASVMSVLTASDLVLFVYAVQSSISLKGHTANVLFASEFAILIASIAGIWARYIVGILDLRHARGRVDAPVWEEKSMYLFYIDLAVDFAKLLTYLIFCIVIFLNHGFPIHILRDVYMTLRSFMARWSDLLRYRRATRNMDEQYPDATAAELEASGDHTCIICREEMVARGEGSEQDADGPNVTPKKLACGHIFHFHCLRSWLERQQACPTCRRDVLSPARAPATPRPQEPQQEQNQANQNEQPHPRPQPPAAGAAAGVAQAAADNTRAVFEEYFRLPPVNGDAAPIPVPTQPSSTAQSPSERPERPRTSDEERQRSIWGAPITPGRFVRPPLGAAPRWPETRSGSATPSSSQAPPVFTLPGQRGRAPDDLFDENDMPLRHAAAAAALRRFDKGKGKAKERDWDEAPSQRAYLSEAGIGSPGTTVSELSRLAQAPGTRAEARAALEQRLSALRAVDRQVWGLVTELSRLKSAWDFEDAAGHSAAASAPSAPAASSTPASSSTPAASFSSAVAGTSGTSGPAASGSGRDSSGVLPTALPSPPSSGPQPPRSPHHITREVDAPWSSVARSLTPEPPVTPLFSRQPTFSPLGEVPPQVATPRATTPPQPTPPAQSAQTQPETETAETVPETEEVAVEETVGEATEGKGKEKAPIDA